MSDYKNGQEMPHPRRSGGPRGGPGRQVSLEKPKDAKKTLSRLLKYLGRYKLSLVIVFVLVLASAAGNIAGTYFIKPLINNYVLRGDLKGLAGALCVIAVIYLATVAASYLYSRIMLVISQKTMNTIRRDLFDHMQDLPLKYFDTHTHGEIMSRYTNDVDNVSEALNMSVTQLMNSALTVVGTFVMMLVLSPLLTLITVAMLVVMMAFLKWIGSKSSMYFGQQQRKLGEVDGYIEEIVEGQRVVKVFNHEPQAIEAFIEKNESLRKASTNAQTFAGILMPIMGNLSYVNYALTAAVGALMAVNGHMDLGTIGAFLQYTRSFSQPIAQIANQFNVIIAALAGAERIFEVLDEKPEVDDGDVTLVNAEKDSGGTLHETSENTDIWAWKVPKESGFELVELKGDVRFKDVKFGYVPEKTILGDISLYANPGEKIAFVGSTGAGKTTITNLINRFYDIQEGTITYDGIDVRNIKKESLRRSLGMVLQDTHLFSGTVADNIRYGKLDATDEEVEAAAKLANAHSFIKHLPQGYKTQLHSDGSNLSQGQRQLLAIARAAVADPPVLILDEATSSIDTRTERLIEKGMDRLMEGRTVFVIAHRLSTVRNSKAIIVLEGGEIIERGSHDDLIEKQGRYYKLYTGQFELA